MCLVLCKMCSTIRCKYIYIDYYYILNDIILKSKLKIEKKPKQKIKSHSSEKSTNKQILFYYIQYVFEDLQKKKLSSLNIAFQHIRCGWFILWMKKKTKETF